MLQRSTKDCVNVESPFSSRCNYCLIIEVLTQVSRHIKSHTNTELMLLYSIYSILTDTGVGL